MRSAGRDKRLLHSGSAVVPGHEIGGTVVGGALPEGRRGIVYIPVFCGTCVRCAAGRTNQCLNLSQLIGWQRDGGFAEHVDVPARCVLPVPDDIPLSVAVLGLDTVGTAAHALRLALRTQDSVDRALVVGAGPLGLGVRRGRPGHGDRRGRLRPQSRPSRGRDDTRCHGRR
ncbi:alcohol dehydrogenase catalytic domain-containing protein [Micromonospora sp. ATA32]|nr:alcohol dehydrogenase catalytic domain-containing protein [Micromonospora sp. ATA32]